MKTISETGFATNYEITYNVKEKDGNRNWFDKRIYKTENGQCFF